MTGRANVLTENELDNGTLAVEEDAKNIESLPSFKMHYSCYDADHVLRMIGTVTNRVYYQFIQSGGAFTPKGVSMHEAGDLRQIRHA